MELKLRTKDLWAELGMRLDKHLPEILTVLRIDYATYEALIRMDRGASQGNELVYRDHLLRIEILLKEIESITGKGGGADEIKDNGPD